MDFLDDPDFMKDIKEEMGIAEEEVIKQIVGEEKDEPSQPLKKEEAPAEKIEEEKEEKEEEAKEEDPNKIEEETGGKEKKD